MNFRDFFKRNILTKNNSKKEIFYVFFLLLFLITIFIILSIVSFKIKNDEGPKIVENIETPKNIVEHKKLETKVYAKSAYVKRLNTNEEIFLKNENIPLPLASITKIMTALVAIQKLNSNSVINVSPEDLETEGNYNIQDNEKFSLKNSIDFSLLNSANDISSALASSVSAFQNKPKNNFIQEINTYAKKIGMESTIFKNETGLDLDGNTAGAVGSAKDVAKMIQYAFENHPEIFEATSKKNMFIVSNDGYVHDVNNTNEIISEIKGILGSKTGYTDIAGGNLAIIVDLGLNDPYIIVVLGSTQEGRFTDIQSIINYIKNK